MAETVYCKAFQHNAYQGMSRPLSLIRRNSLGPSAQAGAIRQFPIPSIALGTRVRRSATPQLWQNFPVTALPQPEHLVTGFVKTTPRGSCLSQPSQGQRCNSDSDARYADPSSQQRPLTSPLCIGLGAKRQRFPYPDGNRHTVRSSRAVHTRQNCILCNVIERRVR